MDFRQLRLTVLRKLEKEGLRVLPNGLMLEIYETGVVRDERDQSHPLTSAIHPQYARTLYDAVLTHNPKIVAEIGMAEGLSSLAILAALRDAGQGGRLISIDPHQHNCWHGIGVANVRRAGLSAHHQLVEKYDYVALPELLNGGVVLDFAYVDGTHTFDYTLLDFFYVDKLLRIGGIVGFNDCGYRAVRRVLGFVRTHRKYQELIMEQELGFSAAGMLAEARSFLGRVDRYFEKIENWEPAWNFYTRF